MPQRQMTLTSQGNMATRPVSNMDKLIKLLHTIEIEVQDKSGKGAWTGARLWYRPLKTPQKREPRRKKKKAREVAAAGRHAGQVVVHNGVPPSRQTDYGGRGPWCALRNLTKYSGSSGRGMRLTHLTIQTKVSQMHCPRAGLID